MRRAAVACEGRSLHYRIPTLNLLRHAPHSAPRLHTSHSHSPPSLRLLSPPFAPLLLRHVRPPLIDRTCRVLVRARVVCSELLVARVCSDLRHIVLRLLSSVSVRHLRYGRVRGLQRGQLLCGSHLRCSVGCGLHRCGWQCWIEHMSARLPLLPD